MNLLQVSQMLSGSPAPHQTENPAQLVDAALLRRKTFRWGFGIMWAGLLLILIMGIGGDAVRNLNGNLGRFIEDLAGLGVIPLLSGVGLMIYSRFQGPAVPGAPPAALPPQNHAVNINPQSRSEPAPSVTEGTTYQLDLPDSRRH